jgi:hypothetical protein
MLDIGTFDGVMACRDRVCCVESVFVIGLICLYSKPFLSSCSAVSSCNLSSSCYKCTLRLMNKGHLPIKGHLQASFLLIRFSLPAFTAFLASSTFCHGPWLHPGRKLPLLLGNCGDGTVRNGLRLGESTCDSTVVSDTSSVHGQGAARI